MKLQNQEQKNPVLLPDLVERFSKWKWQIMLKWANDDL